MVGFLSDEARLRRKALAGSERAWLKLVKRYEGPVYNYALRLTGSPDDAMDILQDVLMSVYRNLESYEGRGSFRSWVFRIASFRTTDHLRKRRGQLLPFDDQIAIAEPANALEFDANRSLMKSLALLSPDQRQVVELKFFQHFTFDEISAQLGISSNTAKTRLYAALSRLRGSASLQQAAESTWSNP